jgi:hypothetical protein
MDSKGGRWYRGRGCEVQGELASYLGKWEQMVMTGRGVAYSKGWPKLPENPFLGRKGAISWSWGVGGSGISPLRP